MASLIANCLARLVKEGRVSPKQAKDAQALHDGMQGRLGDEMGPASAEAVAALQAAKVMGEQARLRKVSIAKQAIVSVKNDERIAQHPKGVVAGVNGLFARDNFDWHPTGSTGADDVDTLAEVIQAKLDTARTAEHEAFRHVWTEIRQNPGLAEKAVHEIFNDGSGDQTAKAIANGWASVDKMATTRAQAAGKLFSYLEDYRIPQGWRSAETSAVKEPEFVNDLADEIRGGGIAAVMDKETGAPATALKIPAILSGMYKDITVGGGKGGRGAAFSPQMRVIRFADGKPGADAYLRLMKKYGNGNDIPAMMDAHVHAMAREIALIEKLGPNYRAEGARLIDKAKAAETVTMAAVKSGSYIPLLNSAGTAEKTFKVLTGNAYAVQSEFWAGLMSGIRGWLRGVQLGGASISAAPGDAATMAMAAGHNGISAAKVLANTANTLVADSPAKRSLAVRLGVQAYATSSSLAADGRGFMAWMDPKNLGNKVANFVVRKSGLEVLTNAEKREFSMAFNGAIAERVGQSFGKLDAPFARFLTRYQISPAEWDTLRATPLIDAEGGRYFDTLSVPDGPLGEKLMGGIISERKFAVVEPDARVQGILTPGAPRGSFVGETVASGAMYHSFSMSMINTHLMRSFASADAGFSKPLYFAKLSAAAMIAGAMTVVARDIVYGKDPRRMNTPAFWGQAALQGGGAGIFGDFFSAATNRSGGGIAATVGGPVAGLISDTYDTFMKPAGEFLNNKRDFGANFVAFQGKFGAAFANYLRHDLNPETFYTRLAMDRLVFDEIQSLIDPQYRASFRRTEQNLKDQYATQFWWKPGTVAPQRPPNMGNVVQ